MKKSSFYLTAAFLLLLFSPFSGHTQALYPVSLDEKVAQSQYIIEGRVVEKTSFWNPAHTMIYTANKIQVYKSFKGAAIPAFAEILTVGGNVGNESIEASDLLTLETGETGMFFCYPNSINLHNPASNNLLWDVYSSAQGFYRYDPVSKIADAPFVKYNNILTELYPEIQQKTGNGITVIDPSFDLANTSLQPTAPTVVNITSFNPTTVNSGATIDAGNNLLTITGTGFGSPAGSAAVLFDDANNGTGGTVFTVAYNDPLIVTWSNTQIQVRVPARAGTGTFQVRDDLGATGNSPSALNVRYGVLTSSIGGTIKESNLMNDNGSGGYTILYSTNTAGGGVDLDASPVKQTFQRALNTWKEISGFNVTEGGTTTIQTVTGDGSNVIMFDNTNTGQALLAAGVLGVCFSYNSMCSPVATNQIQKTEFDIVIRNNGVSSGSTAFTNGPCFPATATAEYDLETVLLHELGHALNLAHINDSYEGSFLPNLNPGKLMNFAVINGVSRRSPDWSATTGAVYVITPQANTYGSCGLSSVEMTPLATTLESKDECPGSFPGTTIASGTSVSFDLVHATSNKNVDPQYTAINCAGTGQHVTNTAFYALRTNATGGNMILTVSGYATTPSTQSACSGAGIQLSLYQTSSCPAGQAFPAPIACRTFNANGALTTFSGLAANTNYLLFATGLNNTKANFTITFTGTAIPIKIASFTGVAEKNGNNISWKIENVNSITGIDLESSPDGSNFSSVSRYNNLGALQNIQGSYFDNTLNEITYYRIKAHNLSGQTEYSNILAVKRSQTHEQVSITPNPAKSFITVSIFKTKSELHVFELYDVTGKLVLTRQQLLAAGQNTVQLIGSEKLSNGIYTLKINTDGSSQNYRVAIQR